MKRLHAAVALAYATAVALAFVTNVHATDNCGDIDRGPAVRVIAEECRAQQVEAATCARIAANAVRRMAAM
jgi:hypothetical protein